MSIQLKYTNTQIKVKASVITPIHVGGSSEAKWQPGIDYIHRDSTVYILDTKELFNRLPNEDVDRLGIELGQGAFHKIGEYLDRNGISIGSVSLGSFDSPSKPKDEIFTLIRTGRGIPYIPGSSLKGSIRSILGTYIFNSKNLTKRDLRNSNQYDKVLFGDITNNVMKFLQVGDLSFDQSETDLIRTKTFNLQERGGNWEAGWKHGNRRTDYRFNPRDFVFTYEVFPIGSTTTFRLNILDGLKSYVASFPKKGKLPDNLHHLIKENPAAHLMKTINNHTEEHLKREYNFFVDYDQVHESSHILDRFEDLMDNQLPKNKDKACLIRLAAGSGFHSITGDWQYEDHDDTGFHDRGRNQGKKKYKSRKFAFRQEEDEFEFYPMGFLKLEIQ